MILDFFDKEKGITSTYEDYISNQNQIKRE